MMYIYLVLKKIEIKTLKEKKYNILTEKCCELEEKKMISENVVNDFIKFTKKYLNFFFLNRRWIDGYRGREGAECPVFQI